MLPSHGNKLNNRTPPRWRNVRRKEQPSSAPASIPRTARSSITDMTFRCRATTDQGCRIIKNYLRRQHFDRDISYLKNAGHFSTPKPAILHLEIRPLIVLLQFVSRPTIRSMALHNDLLTVWIGSGLTDGRTEFLAPSRRRLR